jgi:hypothetical protein
MSALLAAGCGMYGKMLGLAVSRYEAELAIVRSPLVYGVRGDFGRLLVPRGCRLIGRFWWGGRFGEFFGLLCRSPRCFWWGIESGKVGDGASGVGEE